MNKLAKSLLVVALLSGGEWSAAIKDVVQHFVRNAHLFCKFGLLNVSIFHFFFDDFTRVNWAKLKTNKACRIATGLRRERDYVLSEHFTFALVYFS